MLWAATVLFCDTKKDERLFFELEPGKGFIFQSRMPFEMKELEERINQKLWEKGKEFFIRITKNLLEKDKFEAACFPSLLNAF